jgi:hypothetical protein
MFSILGTGVFCLLAAGSMEDSPSNSTAPESAPSVSTPPISVNAETLYLAYHRNEVSADAAYKGRTLEVSGIVESIDKDFMDEVVIRLATSNEFESVDAHLNKSEESAAAQLEKGQVVKLTCTGGGMIVGSPTLSDCAFGSN